MARDDRGAADPVIRPPDSDDIDALADLFSELDSDPYFHPHEMDRSTAKAIAEHRGRDVYLVAWDGERAVAYGMLRGWDDGHEVPSLGVAVRASQESRGYGQAMMAALHAEARDRGATAVRLRVHPDNLRAQRLYELLGYREMGVDRDEIVMRLRL